MLSAPKVEWAVSPGLGSLLPAESWEFRGHGLHGRERHSGCLVLMARVSLCVFVVVFSEMPTLKPTK